MVREYRDSTFVNPVRLVRVDDIKPCPTCGTSPSVEIDTTLRTAWKVACPHQGTYVDCGSGTREEAIERWNTLTEGKVPQ